MCRDDRPLRRVRLAGAAVVSLACAGQAAQAHDWYGGLRSPSGLECCDLRDCRRVAYRLNARDGREEIEANGRWWPVEQDKVLALSTPDGEAHACWRNPRGKPEFRCIILPGMAELGPLRPVRTAAAPTARAADR